MDTGTIIGTTAIGIIAGTTVIGTIIGITAIGGITVTGTTIAIGELIARVGLSEGGKSPALSFCLVAPAKQGQQKTPLFSGVFASHSFSQAIRSDGNVRSAT